MQSESINALTIQQPWVLFMLHAGMDVLSRHPFGTFSRSIAGPCVIIASKTFDEDWHTRIPQRLAAKCVTVLNRKRISSFGAIPYHFGQATAITTFGHMQISSPSQWLFNDTLCAAFPFRNSVPLRPWPCKGSLRMLSLKIADIPLESSRRTILDYLKLHAGVL